MSSSTFFERKNLWLLLSLVIIAVAVAVPLASARAAHQKAPATDACRAGDAPLPNGASTNSTSGAGLTARGFDSQSAGATPHSRCRR